MAIVGVVISIIGLVMVVVGAIKILVAAFREHVLWGIGSLVIPLVAIVFAIMHFAECKRGLAFYVGGFAVMLVGSVLGGAGAAG